MMTMTWLSLAEGTAMLTKPMRVPANFVPYPITLTKH